MFILIIFSCTNENEEELVAITTCDTLDVSYSKIIKPIFDENCSVCHNATLLTANFNISDFNQLKTRVKSGLLIGAINRFQGWPQMPKNGTKLPECTIKKIVAWRNKGIPND
jgi:mono/diheme cytochrome c family protein